MQDRIDRLQSKQPRLSGHPSDQCGPASSGDAISGSAPAL